MKATCLFLVFLLAKTAVLWGHAAPLTMWPLIAYTWQDVLAAMVFAALCGLRSPRQEGGLQSARGFSPASGACHERRGGAEAPRGLKAAVQHPPNL